MSDSEAAGAAGDLKGGHPPAEIPVRALGEFHFTFVLQRQHTVKVGGMRVVQHKKEQEKTEPMTQEEQDEFGSSPPKADKHHSTAVVSGAMTKGDKDFPPQAVRAYHDKPQPTHEKHRGGQAPQNIHQPR